ncbi:MAG TPA: polyprenyl diphosphate synthase [Candidatus Rubrimentiphilum sp.]|nr:polyprenyl diphosphate synthase [Candidatus Rubrimentiphilum sp.]
MHIAIIMDGNRRWAAARGLPAAEGYRQGVAALRAAVRGALHSEVEALTVYGFSTENWRREAGEVSLLMQLCAVFARVELRELQRGGVRVRVIGDLEPFALPARAALHELVRATSANRRLVLNLALNYSGRAEIVRAAKRIAADVESGRLRARDVDEAALRCRFYDPQLSDPDLLIRTGGDLRVSNFLLYQLAYTELLTLPIMWPDFTKEAFEEAIKEFGVRSRRFGT